MFDASGDRDMLDISEKTYHVAIFIIHADKTHHYSIRILQYRIWIKNCDYAT